MSDTIITAIIGTTGLVIFGVITLLIFKKPITELFNRTRSAKLPWIEFDTFAKTGSTGSPNTPLPSPFSSLENFPEIKMENYGNLFWAGHDFMWTIAVVSSDRASRANILHGLNQTLHHVRSLGFSNTPVVIRLTKLKTDAENSLEKEWTLEKREELIRELSTILEMVSDIAEKKQVGFKPQA